MPSLNIDVFLELTRKSEGRILGGLEGERISKLIAVLLIKTHNYCSGVKC
jgi:hypothetical protein